MEVIIRRGQTVEVRGWESRFAKCDYIQRQVELAQTNAFTLLYRGQSATASETELFLFGQKARPFYVAQEPSKIRAAVAKHVSQDEDSFRRLAAEFADSGMARRGESTFAGNDAIMETWRNSTESKRFRLAELLLYSLQYQNCRIDKSWKENLLLLSASLEPTVAMRYALSQGGSKKVPTETTPERGFIIEFAYPSNDHWYERVSDLISEFRLEGLEMFPDHDSEVFVLYAIFPHYVLGFAELQLDHKMPEPTYDVVFHPNWHFKDVGVSLLAPPKLTGLQEERIAKLGSQMSYVTRLWSDEGERIWGHITTPKGVVDIEPQP